MGQPLDDLAGLQQPVASDLDAQRKIADAFVKRLLDMEDDGTLSFAYDTLHSIREHVERTQRVTPGQQQAIDNIQRAGDERHERHTRGKGSRRYEGWGQGH